MTDAASPTLDATLTATAAAGPGEALAATVAAGSGEATARREQASTGLERGALVGRYVVLSRLGAGGMGEVFAVYDPELDRKVALKLLHRRLAVDADPLATREARARLVREAQALARLNHPHIVAIHDVGEHAGAVWLAMEYVDGETLTAWSRRRRRRWREVLEVMTPAARGLSAAHAAGLVHRDIKPDNLMVGRDGRVRVMDLGLARGLDGEEPTARVGVDGPTRAQDGSGQNGLHGPPGQNGLHGPPGLNGLHGLHGPPGLTAQVTRVGSILGTPAYMSPEQFLGMPVDARADVFSFCVTLWEALMGERPFAGETIVELAAHVHAGKVRPAPRAARDVPGWLRRVCLRGLAVEPGRRFASMEELLAALSRGRTRARVRNWLVGAAAVAAVGGSAAVYQRHERGERVAACARAGAEVDAVWSDEARARVQAGIVATGRGYAVETADRVVPFLAAHAAAWREQRTAVCLAAEVESTLAPELRERALWCLDERRMELAALLTELARADDMVAQNAVSAAADLPPVSPCTDPQVLAALPSPPPPAARAQADAVRATLSEARALLAAGKYGRGRERAHAALVAAEALGWPPMTAAARQLDGDLLERTGEYADAEAASLLAYMDAAKVRAWDVAAAAAVQMVTIVGDRRARHAEGEVWAGHAEVAVLLAGDPLGLREASRLGGLADIHHVAGEYAEARALYERTLASWEQALGPEHPAVARALNNLANAHLVAGEYAEARALHRRALAIRERALGPDHPDVAQALHNLANVEYSTGAYAEARRLFARSLAIWEDALGPDHPDVAAALNNLAATLSMLGAHDEAKALHERALAIKEKALGPDHPDVATSLNNLANVQVDRGADAEARALYERSLAIWEKALGPDHPDVAQSLHNLAGAHARTGAAAEAEALFERALAIRERALGRDHPDVAASLCDLGGLALDHDRPAEAVARLERAVAIYDAHEGSQADEPSCRFRLARALALAGGDRTRALAEARRAADGFHAAGEVMAAELAEVEVFLAGHPAAPP